MAVYLPLNVATRLLIVTLQLHEANPDFSSFMVIFLRKLLGSRKQSERTLAVVGTYIFRAPSSDLVHA